MSETSGPAKLLVKAALEAVLSKSASRLDAEARGARIKAAALMECADKGYPDLTIGNIAKRAKVSTATIYAEYPDRDNLLVAAMEMLFALLASDVIETPAVEDPQERVAQLLIAHGQVYAEPLTAWITRLHVILAWAGHDHLRAIGQQVFRGIDAFWVKFLGDLEAQGHLTGIEPDLVVPLLLGPVERSTIIARLGCGGHEPGRPSYAEVARDSAARLFRLWGAGAKPLQPGGTDDAARSADGLAPAVGNGVEAGQDAPAKTLRNTPHEQKVSILRAARTICGEHGYEAASIRDIASRAGVSSATLYEHFADKTGLFCSVLESEFALRSDFRHGQGPVTLDATLMQIASRAADPQWEWMHNVLMASSISDDPRVVAIGRKNREMAETFLAGALAQPPDALTLNFLLGGIERSGVLAQILFGPQGVDAGHLARLAAFTAQCHDRLSAG